MIDLSRLNMPSTNFNGMDLSGAKFVATNLQRSNFRKSILSNADFGMAELYFANFQRADLRGADLTAADLTDANLTDADLTSAIMVRTNLVGTNFTNAVLIGTVIDPSRVGNAEVSEFKRTKSGMCIGYRSKKSPIIGDEPYIVGQTRIAHVFSTCFTDCHPGIYVCPTKQQAKKFGDKIVEVIFSPNDCHRAGYKWRVKRLTVVSE